jgi:hypothetical protein
MRRKYASRALQAYQKQMRLNYEILRSTYRDARTRCKDLRRLDQYDHWLDYDFADGVVTLEEYDIGKGWIHSEMAQRVEVLKKTNQWPTVTDGEIFSLGGGVE